jgi:hypothetical protein
MTSQGRTVNCRAMRGSHIKPTNEKGGPKAAPSPTHLERNERRRGLRRFSPFKAGPKDIQRGGCNRMTRALTLSSTAQRSSQSTDNRANEKGGRSRPLTCAVDDPTPSWPRIAPSVAPSNQKLMPKGKPASGPAGLPGRKRSFAVSKLPGAFQALSDLGANSVSRDSFSLISGVSLRLKVSS